MSHKNFVRLIDSVFSTFREARKEGVSSTVLDSQVKAIREILNAKHESGRYVFGSAKRQVINEMIRSAYHDLNKNDLTLGYEKDGVIYCTYNAPVAGHKSTEELHNLPISLTSAEWDAMVKRDVWINSGKIYK